MVQQNQALRIPWKHTPDAFHKSPFLYPLICQSTAWDRFRRGVTLYPTSMKQNKNCHQPSAATHKEKETALQTKYFFNTDIRLSIATTSWYVLMVDCDFRLQTTRMCQNVSALVGRTGTLRESGNIHLYAIPVFLCSTKAVARRRERTRKFWHRWIRNTSYSPCPEMFNILQKTLCQRKGLVSYHPTFYCSVLLLWIAIHLTTVEETRWNPVTKHTM